VRRERLERECVGFLARRRRSGCRQPARSPRLRGAAHVGCRERSGLGRHEWAHRSRSRDGVPRNRSRRCTRERLADVGTSGRGNVGREVLPMRESRPRSLLDATVAPDHASNTTLVRGEQSTDHLPCPSVGRPVSSVAFNEIISPSPFRERGSGGEVSRITLPLWNGRVEAAKLDSGVFGSELPCNAPGLALAAPGREDGAERGDIRDALIEALPGE